MKDILTQLEGLILVRPDPIRDAPFALSWFESSHGKETLLLMGNTENAIGVPTLSGETATLKEFIQLEKEHRQLTWMIRYNNKTIGAVWLELEDTKYVKSPAFHIMIGDKSYRGQGIGSAVIQEMIRYAQDTLKAKTLYSRHLTSNQAIAHLVASFGFANDGPAYIDDDGLEFQNIILTLQQD